jgi:hypothetical protein
MGDKAGEELRRIKVACLRAGMGTAEDDARGIVRRLIVERDGYARVAAAAYLLLDYIADRAGKGGDPERDIAGLIAELESRGGKPSAPVVVALRRLAGLAK